jgi:Nucleotidyltransferase/DNA polymerase involved in DNA repair
MIWVDARGLSAQAVGDRTFALAEEHGIADGRVGVARTAVAAAMAATVGRGPVVIVPPGGERAFLAPYPLRMLADAAPVPPSPRLDAALADVGIERCCELAALTLEEIEVRFGAEGVDFWRLARAQDRRRIFPPASRTLPSASLAWEEYALRDVERLAFVVNRLAGTVCAELQSWGEGARGMTLALRLTNRTTIERRVRSSRETANRATWTRLLRAELERLALRGAVSGLSLHVDAVGEVETPQGDLFDRGLQTARAVEEALSRLLDDGQATVVGLTTNAHPRPEQRAQWGARPLADVLRSEVRRAGCADVRMCGHPDVRTSGHPTLSLQLVPAPRAVAVKTTPRRDHHAPTAYRERGRGQSPDVELLTAVGPDRISGGAEIGEPYARNYFQCVTAEGMLVLLYHDVIAEQWYLHGWWD